MGVRWDAIDGIRESIPSTGDPLLDVLAAFWQQVRVDLRHGIIRYANRNNLARYPGLDAWCFLHWPSYADFLPDRVDPTTVRAHLLLVWPADHPRPPLPDLYETPTLYRQRVLRWRRDLTASGKDMPRG